MKEWNRMRKGSGGGGFKAGDACGDVFNEIVTSAEPFWGGRLDGLSGKCGVDVESTMNRGSGGWTSKKGGKDVAVVKCG